MNKFKANDKVYFIDIYGYIWSGTIDDIFHANSADEEYAHLKYVKNPYNGNAFGSCDYKINKCISNAASGRRCKP